jgi:O-antigen ligase
MNLNDIIGTVGVGLILLAYFLNIFSWIKKEGVLFYSLNIVGASIACFASILIDYLPFVILEATWAIVSVIGLYHSIKKPQE